MKNGKSLYLLYLIVGTLTFVLTGCGAAQIAIGVAQGVTALGGIPSVKKKHPAYAVYKPNVDTKKIIFKELGKPNYKVDLGNNRTVIAYKYSVTTYMFAIRNGLYQAKLAFNSEGIENDKNKGILVSELIKWFPCFHATVATKPYTPLPNLDTQQTVLSNWGQPTETFVSPTGKVKVFTYHKKYKGYPMAVLAFLGQPLHKIIPMTPENYQGLRAELTGTQDIAALFGITE